MKTNITLAVLLATLLSAHAQGAFSSNLSPLVVTPDNLFINGSGEFSLDGGVVNFHITFSREGVVPMTAKLVTVDSDLTFDLGPARGAIHYPGDGGGFTSFSGSFLLPDAFQDDFVRGETMLLLTGSELGDFQGAVVPVPEPSSVTLFAGGAAALLCFCRRGLGVTVMSPNAGRDSSRTQR